MAEQKCIEAFHPELAYQLFAEVCGRLDTISNVATAAIALSERLDEEDTCLTSLFRLIEELGYDGGSRNPLQSMLAQAAGHPDPFAAVRP
jgi:hypothetical protein